MKKGNVLKGPKTKNSSGDQFSIERKKTFFWSHWRVGCFFYILWNSLELLSSTLWTTYSLLMNFLQTSHELLTRFLWTSYELALNSLKASFELLINSLQTFCELLYYVTFYKHLMNMSRTSYKPFANSYKHLTSILQTLFLRPSFELLMSYAQMFFLQISCKCLTTSYEHFSNFLWTNFLKYFESRMICLQTYLSLWMW